MGYSLFSPRKAREKAPYQDDQSLGQQIGRVDIRCTLKADDSRWTESRDVQNDVQITGLLHFNIEFNAQVGVPLRSASVQIDVGTGVNEEPVPTIKECAPKSAIKGPPMKQHIVDTMTTDPQVELTTPYGGVKGGGRMHQVSKEFEGEHIWYFKAGSPSHKDDSRVTGTCFTWTRTLLGDHASSDRSFDGAIVLHRKNDTHSALRVKVEVQPWLWHHRVNFARSTPRNSRPIKPRAESFLGPEAFAQLQKGIQGQILEQNVKLAGIGKF